MLISTSVHWENVERIQIVLTPMVIMNVFVKRTICGIQDQANLPPRNDPSKKSEGILSGLFFPSFFELQKDEDCRKATCLKIGPKYWGYVPDCELLPENAVCNPENNCADFICEKGQSSFTVKFNENSSKLLRN